MDAEQRIAIQNDLIVGVTLADVVNQLEKDLTLCGCEGVLRIGSPFEIDNLYEALHEFLVGLSSYRMETFMNFLYRVDLPAEKVEMHLLEPEGMQNITLLVFKRELQKVVLRKRFA